MNILIIYWFRANALGHGHPEVISGVATSVKGMTFFANNAAGIELAEEIIKAVPCAEFVGMSLLGRS